MRSQLNVDMLYRKVHVGRIVYMNFDSKRAAQDCFVCNTVYETSYLVYCISCISRRGVYLIQAIVYQAFIRSRHLLIFYGGRKEKAPGKVDF